MSNSTLAFIIFAAVMAQLAVVAIRLVYRAWRDTGATRPSTPPDTKPHPVETTAANEEKGLGWDGYREFVVERRVIEDEARSVCSFYLVPTDSRPLPTYRPGQYLTFKLLIPDPDTGKIQTVTRCYSLSDRPHPDYYRVSIKRVMPPPGNSDLPPGRSSNYFHDHVVEGAHLQIKAPSGHFYLTESSHPIVLIAGGIGITPMLSILNTLMAASDPREVWLFYGVRNGSEHIMKDHFITLAAEHPSFKLHVCYSDPQGHEQPGVDFQHAGRVDLSLLRSTLKLAHYQFYVCGPRPMMESLVPALKEWGVDALDIHYESFGPASLSRRDKAKEAPTAAAEQPVVVTFSRSGKTLTWDPHADSLLEFAEDNDIAVESGCRAGSCGSCDTALESGTVSYNQEPDAEINAGHCLLCISRPSSNITLAA